MNLFTVLNALLLLSSTARSTTTHRGAPSTALWDPWGSAKASSSELTGNLTITMTIDDFKEIFAEELLLTDGKHPAIKRKITQPTLRFIDIPVGIYTVEAPTGKDLKYAIDTHAPVIKQCDNQWLLNYQPKPAASLLTQSFTFLGDKSKPFAILDVDFENEQLTLNVMEQNPNRSFDQAVYARITLKNEVDDKIVFSKSIPGTQAVPAIYRAKFSHDPDYHLELFHAEPNRLETQAHLLLTPNQTNHFWIMPWGLVNDESVTWGYEHFKLYVDQTAQAVRNRPQWQQMRYNPFKDNIYQALPLLETIGYNRTELLTEYQDVLPQDNQPPGPWVGNRFSVALAGLGDKVFLTASVDRIEQTITFEAKERKPHAYFNNTYAVVGYQDASGATRYQQDFIGNQTLHPTKIVLPLADQGGELLSIYHREGGNGRCRFTNQMQNQTIPCVQAPGAAINVTYQLTDTALSPFTPTTTATPTVSSTTRFPSSTATGLTTSITAMSSSSSAASWPAPLPAGCLGALGALLVSTS